MKGFFKSMQRLKNSRKYAFCRLLTKCLFVIFCIIVFDYNDLPNRLIFNAFRSVFETMSQKQVVSGTKTSRRVPAQWVTILNYTANWYFEVHLPCPTSCGKILLTRKGTFLILPTNKSKFLSMTRKILRQSWVMRRACIKARGSATVSSPPCWTSN